MWDNDKDGSHGTTGSSPQSSPPIDMSHLNDLKWSGSSPWSPVVQQRAEPQCDVIDAPLPLALLDGLYTELSHRHGRAQQLLLYTRRHHLLLLSRQVVVHQMNLMSHMTYVCELLQRRPPAPPLLCTACLRLRELTSHSAVLCRRYRGDPFLHPTPTRNMAAALLLMAVKAAILTERFILRVLHRVAQVPAEVPADLCRALTSYNQVVADLSKHTSPPAGLRPFCLSRTLGILAEERGRVMAGEVCRLWSRCRREVETSVNQPTGPPPKKSHVLQGQRSPSSPEVIVQVTPVVQQNRVVPCQGSPSSLGVLVQEDRSQVTPLLQILAGLDAKMWKQGPALYSQYCARLWPATYSCVFHGPEVLPALPTLPEGACASSVRILQDMLTSDDVPEPCVSLGRSLCQSFLCVRSLIAWDSTLCRALSSILTDKCAASTLGSGDPVSGNHSRSCAILVTLCQHLTGLLLTPTFSHQSREGRSLAERPFSPPSSAQQGVLSRCTLSLHLCDMWLQSRTQIFLSSGSLSQLVLITHGDLPVMTEQCRSLVAAIENVDWLPSTQRLYMKIKRSRDVLEGLVVSLPHVLSSVCSRRAQDVFQHMMPARRPWRGKLVAGPDLAPSEFAQVAVSAVVVPVLEGARSLCLEEKVSAVCAAVSVFMEAWMAHILREKIKFSLQGALQLRRDFESVRDVLRSSESRLSPEVVRAALALQVFTQADNAIICLLQQPSRKTYLQAGGCAVFPCCPPLCRVAVDTMSDSLQSLDSLERRVWDGDVPGRVPRHTHDSYLPHNQRQWLSLRVHKSWNGLSLPWEGRVVSEG